MSFDKSTLQLEASASVGADVCVGRCGCLRRSVRMSASVGADVCVGRCRCLRRSVRMSASVGADVLITLSVSPNSNKKRKEQNFDIEVLLFSLVDANGLHGWGTSKGVHLSPLGFAACQSKKCTNQVHQPSAPPETTWLRVCQNSINAG